MTDPKETTCPVCRQKVQRGRNGGLLMHTVSLEQAMGNNPWRKPRTDKCPGSTPGARP